MSSGINCPVECLTTAKDVACPDADFIERNGAWLLTVIGAAAGCMGTVLTYLLRSRCSKISCWGAECVRDVVKLNPGDVNVQVPKDSNS